jgi:hypothetical protein
MVEQDCTDWTKEVWTLPNARRNGFKSMIPDEGVLITGLYLEGACFDIKNNYLEAQPSKELFSPLPIINLLPNPRRGQNHEYMCPCYMTP